MFLQNISNYLQESVITCKTTNLINCLFMKHVKDLVLYLSTGE